MQKTNLLNFDFASQEAIVRYGDEELTCSGDAAFLGWRLDNRLSWNNHIEQLARKISRFAYALRVISSEGGIRAATCAYYAQVHSLLKYGIMFWGRSVECTRIFKLQKYCIRAIFKLGHLESCRDHFKNNNILTVNAIYVLECALFVKMNYEQLFERYEAKHNHSTRAVTDGLLIPPSTHLTKVQKTMLYQCIKVYNNIPNKLKCLTFNKFKAKLKQLLLHEVLYNIDDFFKMSL